MAALRGTVRLIALFGTTFVLFLAYLATRLVVPFSAAAGRASHRFLVRTWARASCAILGIAITFEGEPPAPPFFLVANHLSYIDILVLLTRVDGSFLAKSEIASWPLIGILARSTGTLFVDRTRRSDLVRVNALAERLIADGGGMIAFPEGTSTSGEEVLHFKPSIFEVALRTGVPVQSATLRYVTPPDAPPAYLSVCWWGDMGFVPHFLGLARLPKIESHVVFGTEPIVAEDRKTLALRAQRAVERAFVPVAPSVA